MALAVVRISLPAIFTGSTSAWSTGGAPPPSPARPAPAPCPPGTSRSFVRGPAAGHRWSLEVPISIVRSAWSFRGLPFLLPLPFPWPWRPQTKNAAPWGGNGVRWSCSWSLSDPSIHAVPGAHTHAHTTAHQAVRGGAMVDGVRHRRRECNGTRIISYYDDGIFLRTPGTPGPRCEEAAMPGAAPACPPHCSASFFGMRFHGHGTRVPPRTRRSV